MKIKKGVLLTHPINYYKKNSFQNKLRKTESFAQNTDSRAFLYHLNDGKFLFFVGRTSIEKHRVPREDKVYNFNARDCFSDKTLDMTINEVKNYSRQTINLSRLYLALKDTLARKKSKKILEQEAIDIGALIASNTDNLSLYGDRDRRQVARGLVYDLVIGGILNSDGSEFLRLL